MKVLFISDLHGKIDNLKKLNVQYDKLVVLGDIFGLSHQNNLFIANFLKKHMSNLIIIKGNCDLLDVLERYGLDPFDVYYDQIDNHELCYIHGNNLEEKDIDSQMVIFGHKHYPIINRVGNQIFICVGSLSMPRNGSVATYALYENNQFKIMDLNNNVVAEITI